MVAQPDTNGKMSTITAGNIFIYYAPTSAFTGGALCAPYGATPCSNMFLWLFPFMFQLFPCRRRTFVLPCHAAFIFLFERQRSPAAHLVRRTVRRLVRTCYYGCSRSCSQLFPCRRRTFALPGPAAFIFSANVGVHLRRTLCAVMVERFVRNFILAVWLFHFPFKSKSPSPLHLCSAWSRSVHFQCERQRSGWRRALAPIACNALFAWVFMMYSIWEQTLKYREVRYTD